MRSPVFYILFFLLVSFFLSGCEKEEEVIVGVWERVYVDNVKKNYTREWHFFDNNDLIIRDIYDNGDEIEYHGIYRLKPIFNRTYMTIDELPVHADFITYNTDWQVERLDNEFLVIMHTDDGGVLLREFIKIE